VLTFTSAGTVADHLVLHPALETGNFIIKVVLYVINAITGKVAEKSRLKWFGHINL